MLAFKFNFRFYEVEPSVCLYPLSVAQSNLERPPHRRNTSFCQHFCLSLKCLTYRWFLLFPKKFFDTFWELFFITTKCAVYKPLKVKRRRYELTQTHSSDIKRVRNELGEAREAFWTRLTLLVIEVKTLSSKRRNAKFFDE